MKRKIISFCLAIVAFCSVFSLIQPRCIELETLFETLNKNINQADTLYTNSFLQIHGTISDINLADKYIILIDSQNTKNNYIFCHFSQGKIPEDLSAGNHIICQGKINGVDPPSGYIFTIYKIL